MFRLAHVSDLHLGPLPTATWSELGPKRLLGYVSWRLRRQRRHQRPVLDALVHDLHENRPDHVAITGDLVNLALPDEFVRAASWLRELGSPEWVSLVPGNHDALVTLKSGDGWISWRDYVTSDGSDVDPIESDGNFPFLRERGPVTLIGLSSAIPSPVGYAIGRLGSAQLARLESLFGRLAMERNRFRVLLIHHSPLARIGAARKRLVDAGDFRRCIARWGADLILHGHDHLFSFGQIAGDRRAVPVFGVPSASRIAVRPGQTAQYHVYGIEKVDACWRLHVEIRRFSLEARRFVAVARQEVERHHDLLQLRSMDACPASC